MNPIFGRSKLMATALCGVVLVACDSIKNVEDDDFSTVPTPNVVLAGNVTGLTSSPVVLNAHYEAGSGYVGSAPTGDVVREVDENGYVSFSAIPRGATYTVTVTGLPIGKLCEVSNGSGTATGNVTNVTVACSQDPNAPTYLVSGTVVGLGATAAGMQLTLASPSGDETVSVAAGGTEFAFASELLTDFDYEVTISTPPSVPGVGGAPATVHNCALVNATGTVVASDITDVEVHCGFPVGGSVTVMAAALGAGLKLQLAPPGVAPQTLDIPVPPAAFTFDALLPSTAAASYAVTIAQQPAGQTCVLQNAGAVSMTNTAAAQAAATAVRLFCKDNPGGPFSGTALTGTYQLGTEREFVTFFPDGTFLLGSNSATASERGVEHGFYYYGAFGPGTLWFFVATDSNSAANGLSQYPVTNFFGTNYVPVSAITTSAGQLAGTVSAGTAGAAPFNLAAVASTAGQLNGAWVSADSRRVIIYDTTLNTGFQAAVNGAVNAQDLCITVGAGQTGTSSGSYTANTTLTCASIPGGLAAFNTDATGQFAMPGTFFGPIDFTITAGAPDSISLQPYFFGGPFGPPVVLNRSSSNL